MNSILHDVIQYEKWLASFTSFIFVITVQNFLFRICFSVVVLKRLMGLQGRNCTKSITSITISLVFNGSQVIPSIPVDSCRYFDTINKNSLIFIFSIQICGSFMSSVQFELFIKFGIRLDVIKGIFEMIWVFIALSFCKIFIINGENLGNGRFFGISLTES